MCMFREYQHKIKSAATHYLLESVYQSLQSKYMSIKQEKINIKDRKNRLAGIRASIKDISVLKITSTRLELKLKSKSSNATNDSDIVQETNSSNSKPNTISNSTDFLTYNSFLEKYVLLQKLGQGSNGCVYKCQHKANQNFYAVKKFKVEEEHVLELKRNFLSIQKLSHNSISGYKALYFDGSLRFAYLVMDYFNFPNLSQITLKSEEELKSIIRQLILGLQYLHKHNISHRDIKPENILYDQKEGKVKIIDFGISKKTFLRGVRRDMLTIIGTNFYFAPEIYIGGGYDEKVDIWALGVTIYKMITGFTPFQSDYHSDTIANILKGEVRFDEQIWGKYSPFAKDFVSRLLKEKRQRMSLRQCLNHLWIQTAKKQKSEQFKRRYSFSLEISQDFRIEMMTAQQSISKQEGSSQTSQSFGKKIKLINVNQYDLEEAIDPELFEVNSPNSKLNSNY